MANVFVGDCDDIPRHSHLQPTDQRPVPSSASEGAHQSQATGTRSGLWRVDPLKWMVHEFSPTQSVSPGPGNMELEHDDTIDMYDMTSRARTIAPSSRQLFTDGSLFKRAIFSPKKNAH